MKRFRISMAMLMGAVAVAAIDCWGIRSLEPGSVKSHFLFATGVMPVSSLLILVGLVFAPKLFRSGDLPSFVVGFEATGWTAVFAFVAWSSIAEQTVIDFASAVLERAFRFSLFRLLGNPPRWPWTIILDACVTTLFSLPQLLLALLGGWLARRLRLRARFSVAADRPREI